MQDFRKSLEERFDIRFPVYNYTVNIDEERRLAYFETPKVACTSIKKYMMDRRVGGEMQLASKGAVHDRQGSPLMQLTALPPEEAQAVFAPGYRRFTFVRNPFSRTLSAYLDKIVNNEWERQRHLPLFGFEQGAKPSYGQFLRRLMLTRDRLRDIHYMTQSRLTGGLGGLAHDFIGRFEAFGDDFQQMKGQFYGDTTTEDYRSFGKHHASDAGAKLRSFYGRDEIALVRDIYAIDFAMFGYSLDFEAAVASETGG